MYLNRFEKFCLFSKRYQKIIDSLDKLPDGMETLIKLAVFLGRGDEEFDFDKLEVNLSVYGHLVRIEYIFSEQLDKINVFNSDGSKIKTKYLSVIARSLEEDPYLSGFPICASDLDDVLIAINSSVDKGGCGREHEFFFFSLIFGYFQDLKSDNVEEEYRIVQSNKAEFVSPAREIFDLRYYAVKNVILDKNYMYV